MRKGPLLFFISFLLLAGCRPSREIKPELSFQKFFELTNRLGYLFALQAAIIDFKMLQHRWPNHSAELFSGVPDSISNTANWLAHCEITSESDSLILGYVLSDSLPQLDNRVIEFLEMDPVENQSRNKIETEGFFDQKSDQASLVKGSLFFKQLNDSVFLVSHQFEGGRFTNKFTWRKRMIRTD